MLCSAIYGRKQNTRFIFTPVLHRCEITAVSHDAGVRGRAMRLQYGCPASPIDNWRNFHQTEALPRKCPTSALQSQYK